MFAGAHLLHVLALGGGAAQHLRRGARAALRAMAPELGQPLLGGAAAAPPDAQPCIAGGADAPPARPPEAAAAEDAPPANDASGADGDAPGTLV